MTQTKQQFFHELWKIVEKGNPVTVEVVENASKVLYKENQRYYLDIGNKKTLISRRRARTLINDMVARLHDEQYLKREEQ